MRLPRFATGLRYLALRRTTVAFSSVALACAGAEVEEVKEMTLTELDTLVSLESELLADPTDLAVDERGRIYVLDAQLASIIVLSDSPASPIVIGNAGAGPGEFDLPSALAAARDTLRVVDSGNGRVQVLTSEGTYVRSYPMPADFFGGVSVNGDGRLAVPTQGFRRNTLALTFDPEGQPLDSIGTVVVPPFQMWDMVAIKTAISSGEVPGTFRNMARPVWGDHGDLWLILVAEGAVQYYDNAGILLWSLPLTDPELDHILNDFFERNRRLGESMAFAALSYIADAVALDGSLWLLLNTPTTRPSVILVIDREGALSRRLVFPSAPGAESLAVDPAAHRLYLAVPSEASLLAASLSE